MQRRMHVRQQFHDSDERSEGQRASRQVVQVHRRKRQACGSRRDLHAFAWKLPRQCHVHEVVRETTESTLRTGSNDILGILLVDRTVAVHQWLVFAGSDQCLSKLACGQAWAGSTWRQVPL
jgi:hypothetical protein